MKTTHFLIIIAVFASGMIFGLLLTELEIKPEYTIELMNQEDVLIQTPDTIYKVKFEQIEETITNDNL